MLALPAHLAFGPASPVGLPSPAGRSLTRWPIWPVCRWRLCRNMFSFLVRALQAGHFLSHLSVKWTPAVSSVSHHMPATPAVPQPNPGAPSHPAPPSSAPRMAASRLNSPRHQAPRLNPPLNLAIFNGVKDINTTVTPRATPPRRSLGPYKR
jgi:hypothetical protein